MLEHIEIANPYGPNTRLQRLRGGAQLGGHATSRNAALNHCFDFSGRKGGLGDAFDRHTGHVGYEEQLLRIEGRGDGGGRLVGVDVERPHRRRKGWSDGRYHGCQPGQQETLQERRPDVHDLPDLAQGRAVLERLGTQ